MNFDKYYIVAKGHVKGVYSTSEEFRSNLEGFSGSYGKAFEDSEEAEEYAYQNNVPWFTDKYYVVVIGKKPGIYRSSQEFKEQVEGVSCGYGEGFNNFTEAEIFALKNDIECIKTRYDIVEENSLAEEVTQSLKDQDHREDFDGKYYVVIKGHQPGIYRYNDEYQSEIRGYSGFFGCSFNSFYEAEYFSLENGLDVLRSPKIEPSQYYFYNRNNITVYTEIDTLTLTRLSLNKARKLLYSYETSQSSKLKIYSDGSFKNRNENGWAFSIYIQKELIGEVGGIIRDINGKNKNSNINSNLTELVAVGEFLGFIVKSKELREAMYYYGRKLIIHTDSTYVITQFNNNTHSHSHELTTIYSEYLIALRDFGFKISFSHIYRNSTERHVKVDQLARQLMKKKY